METWAKKEALFKVPKKKVKHTIEGQGDIYIYSLTCGEKDEYESDAYKVMAGSREVRTEMARALLIQRTVHDQHGNLLFTETDIGKIAAMDSWLTEPIYLKARNVSRMTVADMEELVKNSGKIQSDDSGTE